MAHEVSTLHACTLSCVLISGSSNTGGNRADSAKQRHSPQIAIPVDDEEEDLDDVETERRLRHPSQKEAAASVVETLWTGGSKQQQCELFVCFQCLDDEQARCCRHNRLDGHCCLQHRGVTIHSYAGAGLADGTVDQICSKIRRNRKSNSRWLRTQTLIVDEVSMVDPGFLDKIEETARKLRKSSKPFGGIQLVLTGDFLSTAAVTKNNAPTRFAFDAKCWSQVIHEMVNLTQVFRQKDESESSIH
ncbi:hypothetical protein L7F22_040817 [Adiantum nelumboides]|nr:hypothetical protein [Adiantum nelumboides]